MQHLETEPDSASPLQLDEVFLPPRPARRAVEQGLATQFAACMDDLEERLGAEGLSLAHMLRAEIHVTRDGPDAYGALQEAFLSGFAAEPRPARCVSAVPPFPGGACVALGAVAARARPDAAGAVIAADGPAPCAPFPHARAHGQGLWVTAQVGSDPATGSLAPVPGGSGPQLRAALANLAAILRAGGSAPERVVHARLQFVAEEERDMLAAIVAESRLPPGAVALSHVPFIPTAQSGVTVKIDAVARRG